MSQRRKSSLDTSLLYSKLKYKHLLSEKSLRSKHLQAVEFLESKGIEPGKIREHAMKLLASGALAGTLLLAAPNLSNLSQPSPTQSVSILAESLQTALVSQLKSFLPAKIESLSSEQETQISHILYNTWGINAVPKLGDTKLNHVYGLLGAEQHLPRYPGDTLQEHHEYFRAGITPGKGAWGYFAPSKDKLTDDLKQKEKYYVAVQTLYLPNWVSRFKYLRDWYKYRKVVVVNPINGKTIVGDIADAGPSWWTGKHFGGSPEVMAYLGLNVGRQKGPVVLYFVDDPDNEVSLGPLEYNLTKARNTNLLAKKYND